MFLKANSRIQVLTAQLCGLQNVTINDHHYSNVAEKLDVCCTYCVRLVPTLQMQGSLSVANKDASATCSLSFWSNHLEVRLSTPHGNDVAVSVGRHRLDLDDDRVRRRAHQELTDARLPNAIGRGCNNAIESRWQLKWR